MADLDAVNNTFSEVMVSEGHSRNLSSLLFI
jgi:hypothetical protein